MIRVAVPGKYIIGAINHCQHRRFVGFPFGVKNSPFRELKTDR